MSVVAVDIGIAAALTGGDPVGIGGMLVPSYDSQTKQGVPTRLGDLQPRSQGLRSKVPVYRFKGQGALGPEYWPSIGYAVVAVREHPEMRVPADPIYTPVPGSEITTTNLHGQTVVGSQLYTKRDHPDPLIVTVDIAAMAADPLVAQLMLGEVMRLFPAHGGLEIVWADGSEYTLQMDRTFTQITDNGPTLEDPTAEAGTRWIVSYEIQTWLDTTRDTELVRTITETMYNTHKL